ncbi:MAG TPA: hypothetical protein VGG64_15185 [Pirellulales bacterium]|jgi:hypothetical protein|nr:hypothetical protein [Pirellulales bacterium]
MANNYLEFSEVLDQLTEDERRWLEEQLETVFVFGDHEYTAQTLPSDLSEEDADWTGLRVLRDFPDDEGGETDFEFAFYDDPENGQYLWFCANEGGDPGQVGHLVQKFLRQFRRDQCWSLTYATTCSKPRIGEFSGGALFVTADSVELIDAHDIVEQRRVAFRGRALNPNSPKENSA